jgi:hypothetical protein
MEKAKEKKEFNVEKAARQVETALESVFPKAKFFVRKGATVEVLATDVNGYTPAEFDMFRRVFCVTTKTELANLTITPVKKETAEEKKSAAAVPAK